MPALEKMQLEELYLHRQSELVFGLVAPVGTDLARMETFLEEGLSRFGYSPNFIKVTELLKRFDLSRFGLTLADSPEFNRVHTRIKAGNEVRRRSQHKDIFALYAAQQVSNTRNKSTGENSDSSREPHWGTAHIVHSLKHPAEVRTLRRLYGQGFFLLGIYASEQQRYDHLVRRQLMSDEEARRLIAIDADERDGHGQHARDTFQLADVFLPMSGNEDDTRAHLFRFLDLVFGVPWTTPTQDEHGMFMAFAASLRSGSLARQVGAVITNSSGDVIAIGANDAPQFGGGQYWPGTQDQRDSARGVDQNDIEKRALVIRVMRAVKAHFQPNGAPLKDEELLKLGKELFAETGLLDLTEFSREVHAEMAALSACARMGASIQGGTLYVTTFPCHNCAKHIIAAGIKKVYFVEPYPKSKALSLHDDAVALISGQQVDGKVAFTPFLGVGPRRFFDLFSMELSSGRPVKRKEAGQKVEWSRSKSRPRIPLLPYSYVQREQIGAKELAEALETLESSVEGEIG